MDSLHLLVNLSRRSLGGQNVSRLLGLGVNVVLNGKLGKVTDDVLHLGVVHIAVGTSEVIEPLNLVEEVVDNGNDNGDEDGVDPDNKESDRVDPSVGALVDVVVWVGVLVV
eukprot:1147731_1